MRNIAATITACAALLLATAALAASLAVLNRPAPRPAARPAPPQPLGVCVLINPNYADTTIVGDVSQAKRLNGVVTCESGSYVPVTPR